ncbi:MAG: 2,3-bisphosphoglycerate-independent phosphoglycerate mutase [Oscillospiraceae bacterium]|nr:2,3-bisphosphoglycerate-independent phosphoglycerate mutase [Oscillospiraceae bacterium]
MDKQKAVLLIMDGYGLKEGEEGNAIKQAKTPNLDRIFMQYPNATLEASEESVGLPEGQMGNSEVGHLNIGAGRIVYQELTRISKSIRDGDFFENETLLKAMRECKERNSKLHIYGMVSDGGVHSHIDHLLGLLKMCKKEGVPNVFVHAYLDGRDTPPMDAPRHINRLKQEMERLGVGKIATIQGRYYAMNRDRNWDLTEMAYNAIVFGQSEKNVKSTEEAFQLEYEEDKTDEFMEPTVILEDGKPITTIEDGDNIIAFNFRNDRMIQLLYAFTNKEFNDFDRKKKLDIGFYCMTRYVNEPEGDNVYVAFENEQVRNDLGEYLEKSGYSQLRLMEAEKLKHVTFFFDGCKDVKYPKEEIICKPRPDVFTYDEKPEMRAYEITEEAVDAISNQKYDCMIINLANCDAVGHSGILEAVIKATEAVDECVVKIEEACLKNDYKLVIISDHGNAEQMYDFENNEVDKRHTTNKVPIIIVSEDKDIKLKDGILADVSPTLLDLMGLEKPTEMTGESLLV